MKASAAAGPMLRVGVVPMPDFTMLAFAGFLDTLRLAADEGDRSRPVRCAWTVMSEGRRPVRASNGVAVQPSQALIDTAAFDYVAVVGGTLHGGRRESAALIAYLRAASSAGTPLAALCTGAFTLARAGLMDGRRACVSWFHHADYAAEFPGLGVVSDRLFLEDGDRITCAGGVGSLHLASFLVERHCGPGAAEKGLRIMIEDPAKHGAEPQPAPRAGAQPSAPAGSRCDRRVRRALLAMERQLAEPARLRELAAGSGASPRQLSRLFAAELGMSPAAVSARLRLERARELVEQSGLPLSEVAARCGFCDASHMTRRFRAAFGEAPSRLRARERLSPQAPEDRSP